MDVNLGKSPENGRNARKDAALAFDLAKDKPVYVVYLLYLRQFCVCTVTAFLTLILFDTMAVNESVMTAPVGEMTQQELGAMIFGLMVGVHLLHSAVAALNDGR